MKNFRRSRKALSPVVASIILIAVTVAVSIAVAAWMGALTVGFMGSSSLTITNTQFTNTTAPANIIVLSVKNTGTKSVTIGAVKINNNALDTANFVATAPGTLTLAAGATGTVTLSGTYARWEAGSPYKTDLYDNSGQVVGSYQANAPN